MGAKGKLRILEGDMVSFWCKGCNQYHGIPVNKEKSLSWDFNGNYDKPTFSPSILVRSGHYVPEYEGDCWCTFNKERPDEEPIFVCYICHSFVTDGKIQYLSDCTHKYAGQTIDLVDIETLEGEYEDE